MDTAQTIILTTIFNVVFTGLVGGIVIYTLQKKIDATIQKSLFEHQTKFARTHAKALEVLEILHEKFSVFARACNAMIGEADASRKTPVFDQLLDFWSYFVENRIFLPESMETVLHEIFMNSINQ